MRRTRVALVLVVGIIGSLVVGRGIDAAQFGTVLGSTAGIFGPKSNGHSFFPSVSADGRFVAFDSRATNLPDDADSTADVFVRDLVADTTTLVSRATGSAGAKGNGDSTDPSISADGRFVAFTSKATNLPDDADSTADVFVRDLVANTTTLASRATGATGAKGNGNSLEPSISADGRSVAFQSVATNLPDDIDATLDIFVRDLVAKTTTLASRATGVTGVKGDSSSFEPSISADGRYVAFDSLASNLAVTDGGFNVYRRDLVDNTTTLVSRATGASGAPGTGIEASISADGRFVAFESDANNLPDDNDFTRDIFVRDLVDNITTLVSRATGAAGTKGNGNSVEPSISADGRFVAFRSLATNLPDDADATADIFVRDLVANTTTLASRSTGATGAKGNGNSSEPSMSADGRFVAFQSNATNLPDDADATADIFVRDLLGPQGPPDLSINDVRAKEGRRTTTKLFTFTVTLEGVPGRSVTVEFVTRNGTATRQDNDYVFTNGVLTFLPGETTKQITVTVNGDNKREPSETFRVRLDQAIGAEIFDGLGIGTINRDEP